MRKLSVIDRHQIRIAEDSIRNPLKGEFLGGPSAKEAEKFLIERFGYKRVQIRKLKNEQK